MSFIHYLSCLKILIISNVMWYFQPFLLYLENHKVPSASVSLSLSAFLLLNYSLIAYPWTTWKKKKALWRLQTLSISVYFWIPKQQCVISPQNKGLTVVNWMQFGALNVVHYHICKPSKLNALSSTVPAKAYIFRSSAWLIHKSVLIAHVVLL